MADINWGQLTDLFMGFIEEEGALQVRVYSSAFDEGIEVSIPERMKEDFMKRLPLFEAQISEGRNTRDGDF